MSDVLKLNVKSKKLNVKVKSILEVDAKAEIEQEKDYLQTQFQYYFDQGYGEGYKEAKEELEHKFNNDLEVKKNELNQLILNLNNNVASYENDFDKIVLELAFLISEKIIQRELSKDTIIIDVLKKSLRKVLGANHVHVKLNPSDHQLINGGKEKIADESISKLIFEEDPRINKGGCIVETEIGNIDARISNQLNELRKVLEQSNTAH